MAKQLTPTAKCLLVAVYELGKKKKIASRDGLLKILQGEVDEETKNLTKMIGFASCLSLKSKRGKMLLHSLVHQGYLDQRYSEGDYFLALSKSGRKVALEALDKVESLSFKSKKPKIPTIRNI